MAVMVFGRVIAARVEPVRHGLFLRCPHGDAEHLDRGSQVQVDGAAFVVRHLMPFPAGEPEVWALLVPQER
jgi:hypothetical protein